MTAQPVSLRIARSTSKIVGWHCEPADAPEPVAAVVVVVAAGDDTRIAIVDLHGDTCGQRLLNGITRATSEPDEVELVSARDAVEMIQSLTGPDRPPLAMAPPIPTGSSTSFPDLSGREWDVLELVSAGLTNIEIAGRLYISVNTVKTYIRSGYRKIGVKRRSQAVSWGLRHGLGSDLEY